MARLQYSVTEAISWVTSTITLGCLHQLDDAALRLLAELGVARREDLVEQQDVGVDRVAVANPSRARMPDEYVLSGRR